jgi:undecaprenyl-diphosphatase
VLTALLVAVLVILRRKRVAVLAAIAAPVASALTEWVLKPLVERTRGGSLSYPSGHTTGIFALAMVMVVLMLQPDRCSRPVRLLVPSAALLVATAVAIASVAASHYTTDVLGGVCVSVAVVLGLSLLVDAVASTRRKC